MTIGSGISTVASSFADRPWLVINEDNDHYFKNDISLDLEFWKVRSNEALMTKEALEAYADHYCASGKVTHLFWCPMGQCASYDSKVWEPIWWGLTDKNCCWKCSAPIDGDLGVPNNFAKNAKLLFDRGIDPYKVWIDRTRSNGVSPWISMRMNDAHWAWVKNHYRCTRFSHEHPEFKIGRGDGTWNMAAMDYAFPEVREHHLKMFKELVDRYDADGLEMDFLRAGINFRPFEAAAKAPLLTDFLRTCRAYANEKARRTGKQYQLAMRVPPTVQLTRERGFELDVIVKEGLVDVIIPCLNTAYSGPLVVVPYAEWASLVKEAPKPIRIVSGTTAYLNNDIHNPRSLKGWAQAARSEGARDLYLFNLEYNNAETRYAVYREGILDPDKNGIGKREFWFPNNVGNNTPLPPNGKIEYDLPLDFACTKASVRINVSKPELADSVKVWVNGVQASFTVDHSLENIAFVDVDLTGLLKPGHNEFKVDLAENGNCAICQIVAE